MSFKGKKVLVTGGSSGIGAAIAIQFAAEGAEVVIVGRNVEKLKSVEQQISDVGSKPVVIAADLAKMEDVERIMDETIKSFGSLDILINNAGIAILSTIFDASFVNDFDTVFATNFRAVLYLTHLAAPHLVASKGNIISISSLAGLYPIPFLFGYCASKVASDMFTKGTACELGKKGVRINSILPGPVITGMAENVTKQKDHAAACWNKLCDYTCLGRVSVAEETADLTLFLASYKARGITGSLYTTDNGMFVKTS